MRIEVRGKKLVSGQKERSLRPQGRNVKWKLGDDDCVMAHGVTDSSSNPLKFTTDRFSTLNKNIRHCNGDKQSM